MTFDEFFTLYNDKSVEKEDSNALNQCMDLIFAWVDALSIPRETVRHGYAYQVWTNPTDLTRQYFELIANTPNGVPQKGDIVVFNQVVGSAGHVCIANGVGNTSSFQSFDQNWNGHHYATTETHTYNGCSGWLRPKAQNTDYQKKYNDLAGYVRQIKTLVAQTGL